MTLVGVAHEKGIDLGDIEVDVKHKQNLQVRGPKDVNQRQLKITELRRRIQVSGPLTERERENLLWGAEHCPVSNSLAGAIEITTSLEMT